MSYNSADIQLGQIKFGGVDPTLYTGSLVGLSSWLCLHLLLDCADQLHLAGRVCNRVCAI